MVVFRSSFFLLETRLKSESFDTLDDLLGFRVQKLSPKNISNQSINQTIDLLFSDDTFEPLLESWWKAQKTWIQT